MTSTSSSMKRKAQFNFSNDWPEMIAFVLLLVGFVFSLRATSAFLSYIVIVLCGGIFGRIWWKFRRSMHVPIALIAIGFLIGYMLGAAFTYANAKVVFLLFILAVAASYYIHGHQWLKTTDF